MSHAITIALISIYPWSEVFNQITFCFFTLNMSGLVCLGILLFFGLLFIYVLYNVLIIHIIGKT